MGIKGLTKLIEDNSNGATVIREQKLENYFSRRVAIDASMSIYQFLIAVRHGGDQLANADGDVTSHIAGIFYRTVRLIENGVKPVYVFDGKPPAMKAGELAKRKERRDEAQEELKEAKETGEAEDVEKLSKRLVKVSKEQVEDCKTVLRLMGVPVVEAPCEAEAQCAELCKKGKVFATATEDMDALTFSTPVLLRYLTYPEAKKKPILQIEHDKVLQQLGLTHAEFVDLCILCGCDYCDTIPKVGPVTALKLIRQHHSIENIVKAFKEEGKDLPADPWPFAEARELFLHAEVTPADDVVLEWGKCDEAALLAFMCDKHGFSKERIESGIKRLQKGNEKGAQSRLEAFFGNATVTTHKRPAEDPKGKGKGKGAGASSSSSSSSSGSAAKKQKK